jgi:putative transposase
VIELGGPCLLATLLSLIPKARRQGLRLLVTPDTILRWRRDIVRYRWAARSMRGRTGWPAMRRNVRALVLRLARENPGWGTAGSTASWPTWE